MNFNFEDDDFEPENTGEDIENFDDPSILYNDSLGAFNTNSPEDFIRKFAQQENYAFEDTRKKVEESEEKFTDIILERVRAHSKDLRERIRDMMRLTR